MATQIITPYHLYIGPSEVEEMIIDGFATKEIGALIEKSISNLSSVFSDNKLEENESSNDNESENNNAILFN